MRLIDADKLEQYIFHGENDCAIFGTDIDEAVIELIEKQPPVSTEDIKREVGKQLLEILESKYKEPERCLAYYWLKSQIKYICFGIKRICDMIEEEVEENV